MILTEFEALLDETLVIRDFARLDTLNGLQVARRNPEIYRVAFAVDACMESFIRAAAFDADVLFVHHGLFWGGNPAVRRSHYERLRFLFENDIALYAAHLPLDVHPELGNNAGIALKLGLSGTVPFGMYKGVAIGVRGRLETPLRLDQIIDRLEFDRDACPSILTFGPDEITTLGIVSGGGTHEVDQAVEANLDCYITGDASHTMYHYCLEESINLLCGGHYQTETFGVKAVAGWLARETGLETEFIDVPTGL